MSIGVDFVTLINARPVGSELVVSDFFDIPGPPGAGQETYRTIEVPLNVITAPSLTDQFYVREVHPITHVPLGPIFSKVTYPTVPLSGQYQVDNTQTFAFGYLTFNKLDGSKTVEIIYTGRGSLVFASDVNDPRDEIKDARDTNTDLGARLFAIEDGTRIIDYAIVPRHISNVITDDFTFPNDVTITGNLDVVGNITYIQSNTLQIGDNIIELNADVVGAPTQDAGIEINRGSSADVHLYWRETTDNWEFEGGGLHLPDGHLNMDHNQILSGAPEYVASGVAEAALVATATDGQMIWRTDTKVLKMFNAVAGAFQNVGPSISRFDVTVGTPEGTYTGSTTVFDLPFTYNVGSSQLFVYEAGVLMTVGASFDYLETSGTQVTFNTAEVVGRNMSFVNLSVAV